jgi:tetrahydromethanopterin S-methyltransferase subunit D
MGGLSSAFSRSVGGADALLARCSGAAVARSSIAFVIIGGAPAAVATYVAIFLTGIPRLEAPERLRVSYRC